MHRLWQKEISRAMIDVGYHLPSVQHASSIYLSRLFDTFCSRSGGQQVWNEPIDARISLSLCLSSRKHWLTPREIVLTSR